MTKCTVPPPGWQCSREAGHDGPCAATPIRLDWIRPVAIVREQLDENRAIVEWIFNPVPVGEELQWDHGE